MKTIILARVSTEEQMNKGHSIPAQLDKARDYCQRKNLPKGNEYSFDESSIKDHREKFLQVIEEIKKSKDKVALVVETIDRLQRSFKETVLLDELRKKDKVEIHFIREGLVLTVNSNSSEILRWDMGVMFAKSYVLQIADNVKRSHQRKREQGEFAAKAPVGYKNVRDEVTGKKTIVIDKERAYLVRTLFEEYAKQTHSVNTLTAFAKKLGLTVLGRKSVCKAYIHKLLQNTFYVGIMKTKGGNYPHKYGAIVTRELFDHCQKIMKSRGRRNIKSGALPAIFRGLIHCSCCNSKISMEIHKKKKYTYLYCHKAKNVLKQCTNKLWLREEKVLSQIEDIFKDIQLPEETVKRVEKYLTEINSTEKDNHKTVIESLRKEYDNCQKMINALIDMKLKNDSGIETMSITTDHYNQKLNELKQRQIDIGTEMSSHTEADGRFNETLLTVLELARNAYSLFKSSEITEKRQLISFVTTNLVLEGEKLNFSYRKPFDAIAKGLKCTNWCHRVGLNHRPGAYETPALTS